MVNMGDNRKVSYVVEFLQVSYNLNALGGAQIRTVFKIDTISDQPSALTIDALVQLFRHYTYIYQSIKRQLIFLATYCKQHFSERRR